MKKVVRTLVFVLAGTVAAVSLAACAQLDVVGKESINSFSAVLDASGGNVKADELNVGWSLTAPDDSNLRY